MTVETLPRPTRFQRLVQELRTEADSRERTAAAIGIGLFIGCLPIWGVHLALCVLIGRVFRLNRLKMYVAANISNPVLLPLLVIMSVQIGRFLRAGDFYALGLGEIRRIDPWIFGWDFVVGSVVTGLVIGLAGAAIALVLTRSATRLDRFLDDAANRYLVAGITPWEFARQKLKRDPVYVEVLRRRVLPAHGRLIDLGCGQGLLLAALATARSWSAEGRWPAAEWGPAPRLDLHGVELRPRMVRIGQLALGTDASLVQGDAREALGERWQAITLFDVLHLIPRRDQEALLASIARALDDGGVLLVREADADGSIGFRLVWLTNAAKAIVQGYWGRRFAFRSAAGWKAALEAHGLSATLEPAAEGTPFNNVLIVARKAG